MTAPVFRAPAEETLPVVRLAVRLLFLVAGIANAAWAPMVPFAKLRTGLGTGAFGAVLIGLGIGAMAAMPAVSWALRRYGSRWTMIASCVVLTVVLPLLAVISSPFWLALSLACFGIGLGGLDAAMNAQAVEVEIRSARPLMSGFHGMFSVGGLAGSLGVTLILAAGVPVLGAVLIVVACFVAIWASQVRRLLPGMEQRVGGTARAGWSTALKPLVIFLGILCFIGFLGEGAALDWSALFLHAKGVPASLGGIGYAAFSVTMAIGRLSGDSVARRVGVAPLLRVSALVAALGWGAVVLLPAYLSVAGFALVGLGAANIVPLLFGAAARVRGVPTSLSIPLISGLGYAGMLAGPALIGLAAGATSLSVALSGVGLLLIVILVSAGIARQ